MNELINQTVTLTYEQLVSITTSNTQPLLLILGIFVAFFLIAMLLLIFMSSQNKEFRKYIELTKQADKFLEWKRDKFIK